MQQGETVQVVVSEGAPKVEVPDVTEKSREKAEKALTDKGFKVKIVESESSDEDPGTVPLAGIPRAAPEVEKGTEVTLTVAKQAKVTVPPVVGQQFDAAKAQLETLEFTVARADVDSDQPAGTVISAGPDGRLEGRQGCHGHAAGLQGPAADRSGAPAVQQDHRRGQADPRSGRSAARRRQRSERRQGPDHCSGPGGPVHRRRPASRSMCRPLTAAGAATTDGPGSDGGIFG